MLNRPIVVVVDHQENASGALRLTPASEQVLTLARSVTNGDVVAVAFTSTPDITVLGAHGVASIVVPDFTGFSSRVSAVVADGVLAALSALNDPAAILMVSTYRGREVTGRLAALLGSGGATDITDLRVDSGHLVATKSVLSGAWSTQFSVTDGIPIFAVASGAIEAHSAPEPTKPELIYVDAELSAESAAVTVTSSHQQENSGNNLADASVVVVGGRGMDGDFTLANQLAAALGGAVGATRVATDEGWVPRSLQIGQTGISVSPKLYVGLGVSGAVHHTIGIRSAGHIVAVCDDPDAPIFEIADFGVVGDLFDVVPQALEALKNNGVTTEVSTSE